MGVIMHWLFKGTTGRRINRCDAVQETEEGTGQALLDVKSDAVDGVANGKVIAEESGKKERSVLQAKLTRLAIQIGYAGKIILVDFLQKRYDSKKRIVFNIVNITVQGLPLAVTLSLAYSVKKMMLDNNLVRHLDACETMGNATSICSDKTGTLTTNRMTVVQSYINDVHYKETPKLENLDKETLDILLNCISINSSYSSQVIRAKQVGEQATQLGNKTECGMLGFVLALGASYQEIRNKNPEETIPKVRSNDFLTIFLLIIILLLTHSIGIYIQLCTQKYVYRYKPTWWSISSIQQRCFGDYNEKLNRCKWFLGKNGQLTKFGPKDIEALVRNVIEPMASDGLRTICLAYKDYVPAGQPMKENQISFSGGIDWDDEEKVVSDLTAIAIVGIQDPVRDVNKQIYIYIYIYIYI
uniref:Cation_ATPase_C domain-containing protein n=1 Tax=Heterorhabditis bacteriophora TaxID=37862 RepID=A0A1I7WF30_HETBA